MLARTGGPRATDTFHIVEDLGEVDGRHVSRFFASGVRYLDGVDERLARIEAGRRWHCWVVVLVAVITTRAERPRIGLAEPNAERFFGLESL